MSGGALKHVLIPGFKRFQLTVFEPKLRPLPGTLELYSWLSGMAQPLLKSDERHEDEAPRRAGAKHWWCLLLAALIVVMATGTTLNRDSFRVQQDASLPLAAADWVQRLGLVKTAYGSYLRVPYVCALEVGVPQARFPGGVRSAGDAIYNLYAVQPGTGNNQAADPLHSLASDETWHYYAGDGALNIFEFNTTSRSSRTIQLGICAGCVPQHSVVFPLIVGALLADGTSWALTGASSSPGYDPRDSRPTNVSEVLQLFPKNATLIKRLTDMNPSA